MVEGQLNSEAYIRIVKRYVKKNGKKLDGMHFIFQQDCAVCHAAKATTEAMQKMNIRVLPWVAQGPDLNPIELLWDNLNKVVVK